MSNLRTRLQSRPDPIEFTIEETYDTEEGQVTAKHVVRGLPDDYTLQIGMMTDEKKAQKASLYNAHLRERWVDQPGDLPSVFDKDGVYGVLLVQHYLQPETEEMPDGTVNALPPLSEIELAIMCKEMGDVFTKLVARCVMIANNKRTEKKGEIVLDDPTMTVGLGKSEAAGTES